MYASITKACRSFTVAFALLAALAACTTQPPTRGSVANVPALEASARRAADAGNLAAAAELYAELGNATSGAERATYLIESARLSVENGDLATARQRLAEARGSADRDQQQTILVLQARIELDEGRPQVALDTLASLPQSQTVEAQRDGAAVRGHALFALHRYAEAVRTLVAREVWLESAAEIAANQRLLWEGLKAYPPRPGEAAPTTGDAVIDGWLALAPAAALASDETTMRRELLAWRENYMRHPAAAGLLGELLATPLGQGFPRQIALLLPLGDGAARSSALAVRDGVLGAHADGGHDATTIRVYDTIAAGGEAAYQRAQLEGADFIIGPLLRDEVDRVIEQAGFVPTLALNYSQIENQFANRFYQFALAPEDSARSAARHAIANGARTAVALVPNDPSRGMGMRLLNAFRSEFEALGGQLLDFRTFEPAIDNFEPEINDILNISESRRREAQLAGAIGLPFEFEPRARQDVDVIFIGAQQRAAKQLTQQIKFIAANDAAINDAVIYATSEIIDNPTGRTAESDLNDVVFSDAPIVIGSAGTAFEIKREFETYWPQRGTALRLYGMGYDAYRLVELLSDAQSSQWPLPGLSGELNLDASGHIRRNLPLARFSRGRPVELEPLPPLRAQELSGAR